MMCACMVSGKCLVLLWQVLEASAVKEPAVAAAATSSGGSSVGVEEAKPKQAVAEVRRQGSPGAGGPGSARPPENHTQEEIRIGQR